MARPKKTQVKKKQYRLKKKKLDEYLPVAVVAEMFCVTPYTVRKWLREGDMKGVKFGERWYVPLSYLEQMVEEAMEGVSDE